MNSFPFQQVDVFTAVPFKDNPVAVVLDADALPAGLEVRSFAPAEGVPETTVATTKVIAPRPNEVLPAARVFAMMRFEDVLPPPSTMRSWTSNRRTGMRASILSFLAAGLLGFSVCGSAADSRLAGAGCAIDEDSPLKSAGASSKPARAADEKVVLRSAGASRPTRTADEEVTLKPAGASRPARTADEDEPVKSAGASSKPARRVDEEPILKSAGAGKKR
jgi:hypothetical protein